MNIRTTLVTSSLIAASLVSGSAHAALEGRDLNGSLDSFEAYYDTDLDITWLADANYAKTSGHDTDGQMRWDDANTWAANLSFTDGVSVYDNWRLPTVVDTGTKGCNFAYTGTDCGSNVDTATGEMAHLFFDELGNKGYYDTSGNANQPGWGLTNPGPFTNLQAGNYWSATSFPPGTGLAWDFYFDYGLQHADGKYNGFYALAVSPGDVGAVPEAQTYALMLAGLGLIGWRARRRA